jgi:hypothetical protein
MTFGGSHACMASEAAPAAGRSPMVELARVAGLARIPRGGFGGDAEAAPAAGRSPPEEH